MKIYSWNMLFRNRELDRAFDFIAQSDGDVFCLQEVPAAFLERLRALPYSIAFCTDVERLSQKGIAHNYVVTLSKHPITARDKISFPDYWRLCPLRTRIFVYLMRPFHFSKIWNRGGLHVDITIGGTSVRVFNLHLILARPAWRLKEFETAMTKRDPIRPIIVCGDFNIIESPRVSILNWLLGGRMRDALFYRRERIEIEKHFAAHELANVLRGNITHPFARSQLDHILVSNSFSIENATVLPDRFGSDHHPVCVELT